MMKQRESLTHSDVWRAFEVRAMLNKRLFTRSGGKVKTFVLTDKSSFANLFHPWHHIGRRSAGWDWRGATQIRVSDLVADPRLVDAHRREHIKGIARDLRVRREYGAHRPVPSQLTILAYSLGRHGHLVLDGNNRLAGLARLAESGWPFGILVVSLVGPVTGKICPDLFHHQKGGVPVELLKEPDWA